jgi:hypothetical protein
LQDQLFALRLSDLLASSFLLAFLVITFWPVSELFAREGAIMGLARECHFSILQLVVGRLRKMRIDSWLKSRHSRRAKKIVFILGIPA